MSFDIGEWIENMVSSDVLQSPMMILINVVIGIGLVVWGAIDYKNKEKERDKIWNIIAVLLGAVMLGRNLLSLLGIW